MPLTIKYIKRWLKKNPVTSFLLSPVIAWRLKKINRIVTIRKEFLEEITSLVKSGSAVIEVHDYKGIFEIDIRSEILHRILLHHDYESEIARLIEQHINYQKDAIDVGANIGLHTVLFRKLLNEERKVLSFEPVPNALHFLKKNLQINNAYQNVIVYEGLATAEDGVFKMSVIEGKEEYSALGKINHPNTITRTTKEISVKGTNIDNLVKMHNIEPGIVKIDAEGSEHLVFSGASETIRKFKPVIISELSDHLLEKQGFSKQGIMNMLKSLNYTVLDVSTLQPAGDVIEGYFIALPGELS